jgi:signal peptidase I
MKLCEVKGNSMYPVLRDHDIVVVKETALDSLRMGNILVYRAANGAYIVHRFIGKGDRGILYIRGDGYNLPVEVATADSLVGRATGIVRNRRYEPLSRSKELYSWLIAALKKYLKQLIRSVCHVNGQ